jgi:hypothetical protein
MPYQLHRVQKDGNLYNDIKGSDDHPAKKLKVISKLVEHNP